MVHELVVVNYLNSAERQILQFQGLKKKAMQQKLQNQTCDFKVNAQKLSLANIE